MEQAEHPEGETARGGAPTGADDAVVFAIPICGLLWNAAPEPFRWSKKTGSAFDGGHCGFGENITNRQGQLCWVRSEVPDFAMPFYLSGGLLAVLAVLCASVFAMPPHKRRKRMVEGMASAVIEEEAPASIAVSGKPDGASRRNRRRHATHRRSGRASSQLAPGATEKHRLSSTQVRVTSSPTSRPVPKAALSPASAPAITNRLR